MVAVRRRFLIGGRQFLRYIILNSWLRPRRFAVPAELYHMLTYIVSGARWTPQYDLRAFITEGKGSSSVVKLNYRASIVQSTGEDWNDVSLTLSTASPLQGTAVPSLAPYWIAEKEIPKPTAAPLFGQGSGLIPRGRAMKRSSAAGGFGNSSELDMLSSSIAPPPAPLVPMPAALFRQAVASDSAVSATFAIPGQSTIPSEGDAAASQSHKVSIMEATFENVDLQWVTVPKQAGCDQQPLCIISRSFVRNW